MKTSHIRTATVYKHGPTINRLHIIATSAINYNGWNTNSLHTASGKYGIVHARCYCGGKYCYMKARIFVKSGGKNVCVLVRWMLCDG